MQRVRIGLTGLSCVFLLVLLAAAFFGLANHEQASDALTVPSATGVSGNAVAGTPHEPLAELGVAPGYGGDTTANVAAPPALPAPPLAGR